MKIRTQLIISIVLFVIALLIISASIYITNQQLDKLNRQESLVNNIEIGAGELGYLSNDYLLFHEPQQLDRWNLEYASVSNDLSNLSVDKPEQQALVDIIKGNQQRLKEVFNDISSTIGSTGQNKTIDPAYIQLSWSRLAVQTRSTTFNAQSLSKMLRDEEDQARQTNNLLIFTMMGAFVAFLLIDYLLIYGRTIKSIADLQARTRIIGSGNLDYTLSAKKQDDEIGNLAESFNQMVVRLKSVTASKTDLENEISVRKEIERALHEKQEELEVQSEELEIANEELRTNNEDLLKSEEALMDSEERFRALADNIPNLAWMANADGWIFWYNKQWYDYTGTTLEEMQGWGWQKVHHPDYIKSITEEWSASIKSGKPFDNIFPLRGKDDKYRWFLTRITPIKDAHGNIQRWFGTNTDITVRIQAEEALRESEKKLLLAQHIAHLGFWVWDVNEDVLEWSDEVYCIFGLKPQEFRLNHEAFLRFIHPEDREYVDTAAQEALNGKRPYNIDFRILRRDGSTVYAHSEGEVSYQTGKPVSMFGTVQDITVRKEIEEALKESQKQAELYLDLMGHDISNMHQIAMAQLELAHEAMTDEGRLEGGEIELIDTPLQTLERSAKLIDNVRKLQKLKAGEYKTETIDLGRLLKDVVGEHSNIPENDATINYTTVKGCYVRANFLLKDVFNNLVGNAIKHSNGKATINIGVSRIDDHGSSFYQVAIEDNGPGIPDDKKGEVFHRFKRGQTKARGTGLGLYLVKTLVESFHGRVRVEDRVPGDHTKGSKFLVDLPVSEEEHGK